MIESTLYFGDYLKISPTLPAGLVKLVMLDMPYGHTDLPFDAQIVGKSRKLDYTVLKDRMIMHDYLLETLLPTLKRVCAPDAVIVATSNKGFSAVLNFALGDYKVDEGVWVKSNLTNAPQVKRNKMPSKHEHISVFAFSKKYTFNPLIQVGKPYKGFRNDLKTTGEVTGKMKSVHYENEGTRYGGGIFQYAREAKALHPVQKPLDLWKDLIAMYSNEGDLVLDPFAGVGTTAVACLHLNRKSWNIEKDAEYFAKMLKRVEAEPNQFLS